MSLLSATAPAEQLRGNYQLQQLPGGTFVLTVCCKGRPTRFFGESEEVAIARAKPFDIHT
jgi:hypothetical protein